MIDKGQALNDVLVRLFNRILAIEEEAITKASALGLTMSEIHVIEAIGTDEPKSMSEVASDLGVTVGTLTASVNRLVYKGHVTRFRSDRDRRVVLVSLRTMVALPTPSTITSTNAWLAASCGTSMRRAKML